MSNKDQWLCLWSGPVFLFMFLAGFWVLAGFVPPLAPSLTPAAVAALFTHNARMIRFGLIVAMTASALLVPWAAVISAQMTRMQGIGRALPYTQLGAGAAGAVLFINPCLIWCAATYRADRNPELTYLLNDLGWLFFVMPFALGALQGISLAAAIFWDTAPNPILPRWVAYYNLWIAVGIVPGSIAVFFKTGPFAWNGIFPFWLPVCLFASLFCVMFVALAAAIKRQTRDEL
jgi:hypothetical protein